MRLSERRFQREDLREQLHAPVQEVQQQMPQQWPPQWGVNWGASQYEAFYESLVQSARQRKRRHCSTFQRSAAMPHQHPATPGVSPEMDTGVARLPNEPNAHIDDDCGADESTHESSKKQRTDKEAADDIIGEPPMKKQRTSDDITWEPPMETEATSDDVAVKQEEPTNVARGGGIFVFSQARGKS